MQNTSELSNKEVEAFVKEKVKEILSKIIMKKNDSINIHRNLTEDNGRGIFVHDILVCPVEELVDTDAWDSSELFNNKGNNLFLYLKGRMLIQTTTTWIIGDNTVQCFYSVKD